LAFITSENRFMSPMRAKLASSGVVPRSGHRPGYRRPGRPSRTRNTEPVPPGPGS
jgi:hypothetical protein